MREVQAAFMMHDSRGLDTRGCNTLAAAVRTELPLEFLVSLQNLARTEEIVVGPDADALDLLSLGMHQDDVIYIRVLAATFEIARQVMDRLRRAMLSVHCTEIV
jgi:hypothetical protein